MGCFMSTPSSGDATEGRPKKLVKPKWKSQPPMSRGTLEAKRIEFWETSPHYGGRKEIWDALKAATEADVETAKTIVEAAGIIVETADMSICYDELGAKYELPEYVLSDPDNLQN